MPHFSFQCIKRSFYLVVKSVRLLVLKHFLLLIAIFKIRVGNVLPLVHRKGRLLVAQSKFKIDFKRFHFIPANPIFISQIQSLKNPSGYQYSLELLPLLLEAYLNLSFYIYDISFLLHFSFPKVLQACHTLVFPKLKSNILADLSEDFALPLRLVVLKNKQEKKKKTGMRITSLKRDSLARTTSTHQLQQDVGFLPLTFFHSWSHL